MKKLIGKNVYGAISLLIIIFIAFSATSALAKDIVWRWDIQIPATHVYVKEIYTPFVEEVNARSKGNLKITMFPSSGTGLKPSTQLRGLKNNMIDMSEVNTGWNTGDEPLLSIVSLPCLFRNQQDVAKGLKAVDDVLIKNLEQKWDMKILWISPIDEQIIFTVKPISKLMDIKNKKTRTYQRWLELWVNAMGARSVNVPYGEQYSAFQRNLIDAGITGSATAGPMKFHEVVSTTMVDLGLDFIPFFICVSGKSWRELPIEHQNLLLELGQKYGSQQIARAVSVQEKYYEEFKSQGMNIIRATTEDKKLAQEVAKENVWPIFIKEQGSVGVQMLDRVQKALNIR